MGEVPGVRRLEATMSWTRWVIGMASAAALAGCGTTLKERAPVEGSLAERTMVFQESIFAAIERSDTPKEAAARIAKYCERNADAFAQLRVDATALEGDPAAVMAFTMEIISGIEDLARRSQDALSDKADMLEAPEVLGAIENCNVPMPGAEAGEPTRPMPWGEPAVDAEPVAPETDGDEAAAP